MATSPRLPKHLRAALGPEAGEELVTILDEIRKDHERSEARFNEHMARIDRRFDQMDQRFARVDNKLVALEVKLGDVKADLVKWSFLFWCGAVASVAALAGVLR